MALSDRVATSLQNAFQFLNGHIATIDGPEGARHSGFVLDIRASHEALSLGIGATSLGLAVYAVAPRPDRGRMKEMANYLASCQELDGSWTIGPLRSSGVSLTYTTCYALQALVLYGAAEDHERVHRGLKWLLDRANADGAWSLYGAGESHVHATAEVLYTLHLMGVIAPKEVIEKGEAWILEKRTVEHWRDEKEEPSMFLTALAYRALVPNGKLRFALRDTREWLFHHLQKAPCREEVSYHIPTAGHVVRETVSCFVRATVFEALTSDPFLEIDPRLDAEARRVVRRQTASGGWVCPESHDTPMFLNRAAFVGLSNHLVALLQRPRYPLAHDLAVAFRKHTVPFLFLSCLTLIGCGYLLGHVVIIWRNGILMLRHLNQWGQQLAGFANLAGLLGMGVVGAVAAAIRWIARRRGWID